MLFRSVREYILAGGEFQILEQAKLLKGNKAGTIIPIGTQI